jgi:xanthine dehydrogenase accessory factor
MIVLIRGGGDLASGVAYRLHKAGFRIVITELAQPLTVRRLASFSEAVFEGETTLEGIIAKRVNDIDDPLRVLQLISKGRIPVLVDPDGKSINAVHPTVIIDARMLKAAPEAIRHSAKLYIGLGPGFIGGSNCHAAIETQRGPRLGRVYWDGPTQPDSGIPEAIGNIQSQRVLYSPSDGFISPIKSIGDLIQQGEVVTEVNHQPVVAPFAGIIRGLIHPEVEVKRGMKIGDIDPRNDPDLCNHVSDKALSIGGGVLEAILTKSELRPHLWT